MRFLNWRRRVQAPDDDRGQVLLLTAFSLTALFAMTALSIDASHAYDIRNRLGSTADSAARAAAYEIWRKNTTGWAAFGYQIVDDAKGRGIIPQNTTAVVRLCTDAGATCAAPFQTPKYVEAVLQSDYESFFGAFANRLHLLPANRAVAGVAHGIACLITLDPAGGIFMSNPVGEITANQCNVEDAGDFDVEGTINSPDISSATCSDGCANVHYPAPPPVDPLQNLPVPTSADCNGGSPGTSHTINGALTLPAGTYNNITFDGGTLTLSGGIYCFTGTLAPTSPGKDTNIVSTSGVLIYMAPGSQIDLGSNHVDINLSAQTSGPWNGVIIFQDRANTNTATFSKNDGSILVNGAIYIPSASVDGKNANWATSNFCGILIAGSVNWDKPNLTFEDQCTSFGGSPLTTVALAE